MSSQNDVRKGKNVTASSLFGVAAIQILVGAIGWFIYSVQLGLLDRIISFSGIIYVALGIVARWYRLPAALIGAILYIAFLGSQAFRNMDLLMSGLVFKIPIVILLVVAMISALKKSTASSGKQKV